MTRDPLFDLAANRALSYASRLGILDAEANKLRAGLEPWYLKTRFAYRIPLEQIVGALQTYPGEAHWRGGREGGWVKEKL